MQRTKYGKGRNERKGGKGQKEQKVLQRSGRMEVQYGVAKEQKGRGRDGKGQ
jgi:hypothetical protein